MTLFQATSLLSAFQTYIALFLPQGLFMCSDLYLVHTFPRNSHGSFLHFILGFAHMSFYHRKFFPDTSLYELVDLILFCPLILLYPFLLLLFSDHPVSPDVMFSIYFLCLLLLFHYNICYMRTKIINKTDTSPVPRRKTAPSWSP